MTKILDKIEKFCNKVIEALTISDFPVVDCERWKEDKYCYMEKDCPEGKIPFIITENGVVHREASDILSSCKIKCQLRNHKGF